MFNCFTYMLRMALTILFIGILLGCVSRERPQVSNSSATGSSSVVDSNIYVGREVRAPGAYSWTNGMRLTDAILRAGGLTEFATRSRVRLIRSDGTKEVYDYDRILKKKADDPVLRPGDCVSVTAPFF